MLDLSKLNDTEKVNLVENRWRDSADLWSIVESAYKTNLPIWKNLPDWLNDVPRGRSKARDNRTFLAMESIINTITGRPSKPNVKVGVSSDEAKLLASNLQDLFLDRYKELGVKSKFRKSLRHLFLMRLMSLKIVWDNKKNDFNICSVDPQLVRFSKNATSMYDTEFAIELVKDKPILDIIRLFPDKEEEILKITGYNDIKNVKIDNPLGNYKEAWVGGNVFYVFQGKLLGEEKHPYWNWDGLKVSTAEKIDLDELVGGERRSKMSELRGEQEEREEAEGYEDFIDNYFDEPLPPYIFGTILVLGDKPVGDTSLMEQAKPLQEEVDKRTRQISDNAEGANGIVKVDTDIAKITKAAAQAAHAKPRGIWYGKGVRLGVIREPGAPLPNYVIEDRNHAITELDNIFGSQSTFRGESGKTETATGRAILREQAFQRLDELVNLIDVTHLHLYQWMLQMMMVKYDKEHYIKTMGEDKTEEVDTIMRDDLRKGIKAEVIPGQIMPEDRLFIAERAKEEASVGLIDPLTYFELTNRDNPMELAKRLEMYKINPFTLIDLDDEDKQKIMEAQQLFGGGQEQGAEQEGSGEAMDSQKAEKVAQLRQEMETLVQSPEFQSLEPQEQEDRVRQLEDQLSKLLPAQ